MFTLPSTNAILLSNWQGVTEEFGSGVKFALIPSKRTPDMYGTVAQQRDKLAKAQADHPFVRVTSVLEDVSYWQTLREQGDDLAHGDVFERTYNRHFDLPEQRFDGWLDVPDSYVYDHGRLLYLVDSAAEIDSYGRLVVG